LKGDFSSALADYQAALALDPNDKYVALAAGRVQKRLAPRPVPDPKDSAAPAQTSVAAAAAPARPETRIALVIGNSAYANVAPLTNARNDAEALAAALRRIGFTKVTLQLNLSRDKLLDALGTFANEAGHADWAVVYYAGHGLEIGGINYLIPVDAKLASDRDVSFQAIELDKALDGAGAAKKIGIVIVDACRENPFVKTMTRSMASTRSIGRGLAPAEPEGATLVAYATKQGQVADDGVGMPNGPFVTALVKNLDIVGVEIGLLFRKVRDEVLVMTGRRQEPFVYGSLPSEEFYFNRP